MIRICNVSKIYEDKNSTTVALKNITFDLPSKGFIGLSGENGCGKSTLLNLISTIDTNFTGEIFVDDINVREHTRYIRKKVISYVFQDNFFVDNLNVYQNIKFFNSNCSFSNNFDLLPQEKLNNYTKELSGGQKQKVSIYRGLEKEFDILLVDEPTSSLDEKTTKSVFEILSKIAKEKLVILVSHDMEMMKSYCNLIVRLNNGELEYIKDNNTVTDVIYTDVGATFIGEVNLHSISSSKMNKILDDKGKFVIEKKTKSSQTQFDYSIKEHTLIVNETVDSVHSKIIKKSFFQSNLNNIIFSAILLSILLFAFQMFFDFSFFDSNEFMYHTINQNQDSYVICKEGIVYNESDRLTIDRLEEYADTYGVSFDCNIRLETTNTFQFNRNENYNPTISYATYTDFNNFDFVYGNKPLDNSCIAITDYIADALIQNNPVYSNYQDIVSNGIFINEQQIKISGIIKTDYLKYFRDNLSDKDKTDFNYYQQHLYSSLFYLDEIIGDEYCAYYISSCDLFVTLKFTDDIDANTCIINSHLASILGYSDSKESSLKMLNGYLEIKDTIDDQNHYNIVYVSKNMKDPTYFHLGNNLEYFMIDVSNKDFFSDLYNGNRNIQFYCYSFSYARKVIDIIDMIQKLFIVVLVLLLAAFLVSIFKNIKSSTNLNKKLYSLSMLNGDSICSFAVIELEGIATTFGSTIILNSILYFLGYYLINLSLTNTFNIYISIFNSNIICFLISLVIYLVMFIIVYLVMLYFRTKKDLLKMIK